MSPERDDDDDATLQARTLRDANARGLGGRGSLPDPIELARPIEEPWTEERYELGAMLGEGGMGEVRLVRDRRIGRQVAMKVIRSGHGTQSTRERFEREARIQGQLEHPSVVPVYDLGLTPDGNVFFTMKRVRGRTLADILQGLALRDAVIEADYTQRRLLSALADVCLSVAYAHARGVVHRDLKPGNVMLGSFGEVHVLDWGIAKIGASEAREAEAPAPESAVSAPISDATRAGDLLGTPGYMAPEQVRAAPDLVDERADVYALGAILFEVLTLTALHDRANLHGVLSATMKGVDARARTRAPARDVAPELEAICVRATALDPDDRYPSALAMHAEIERYLAGDRDLERRRGMAEERAQAAATTLARAQRGEVEQRAARQEAMRDASAALALDPDHARARAVLVELLVSPPDELTDDARAELARARAPIEAAERRRTFFVFVVWAVFLPFTLIIGVKSFAALAVTTLALAAALISAGVALRQARDEHRFVTHLLGCFVIGACSLVVGPFVLVPGMASTLTHAFVQQVSPRYRALGVLAGALAIVVPFALELAGMLPPSYAFHDDVMSVLPRAVALPKTGMLVFLLLASVNLVAGPALYIGRLRERAVRAEEKLFLQAWNLRHLVPAAGQEAARSEAGDRA